MKRFTTAIVVLLFGLVVPLNVGAATPSAPSIGTPLTEEMKALFTAANDDSLVQARPLFFPEAAYVAMKRGRITNPASDYASRLVAFYRLDLAAYYQLFHAAGQATFVGISTRGTSAQWISPGICENSFGYWHLGNVRLIYAVGALQKSVLVASLISYENQWYVVHLGPNPRAQNVGTVDSPASATAPAGPGGGC